MVQPRSMRILGTSPFCRCAATIQRVNRNPLNATGKLAAYLSGLQKCIAHSIAARWSGVHRRRALSISSQTGDSEH